MLIFLRDVALVLVSSRGVRCDRSPCRGHSVSSEAPAKATNEELAPEGRYAYSHACVSYIQNGDGEKDEPGAICVEPAILTGNGVEESDEESHDADWEPRIDDQEDFAEVFREFYAPLVRYARGITKQRVSAEDVVQEVFAKLWEDRQTITVKTSLKGLLYTMVRNRALNANRKKKNAAGNTPPQDIDDRQGGEPGADQKLSTKNLRKRLSEWIEKLSPRRKEAFVLSRYHGLSHSEIASIMDISKRTVDKHIELALRELRRRFDTLKDEDASQ